MILISGPAYDEHHMKWISIYEWFDGNCQPHQEIYEFDSEEEAIEFDESEDVNKW